MLVGLSVGWSHCEDDLSNHENMHENAVIHDDTSYHDDDFDPANHDDSANMHEKAVNHDDPEDGSRKCKNVVECAKEAC